MILTRSPLLALGPSDKMSTTKIVSVFLPSIQLRSNITPAHGAAYIIEAVDIRPERLINTMESDLTVMRKT
jgi:hypothetical protein